MRFEWDEPKRLSNLEKHGLDFVDVGGVFEAPHVVVPSAFAGGEERFLVTGVLDGRGVAAVCTVRSGAAGIISFRRARHEERKKYEVLYGGRA